MFRRRLRPSGVTDMADLPDTVTEAAHVFERDGECWTIVFAGERGHLRDTRGLRIVAVLLGRPGELLPASEVIALTSAAASRFPSRANRERDRVRVTRAIHAALRKLGAQLPALETHLRSSIRTGHRCSYVPQPAAITWRTAICVRSAADAMPDHSDVHRNASGPHE